MLLKSLVNNFRVLFLKLSMFSFSKVYNTVYVTILRYSYLLIADFYFLFVTEGWSVIWRKFVFWYLFLTLHVLEFLNNTMFIHTLSKIIGELCEALLQMYKVLNTNKHVAYALQGKPFGLCIIPLLFKTFDVGLELSKPKVSDWCAFSYCVKDNCHHHDTSRNGLMRC